jgi:nitrile hydratase
MTSHEHDHDHDHTEPPSELELRVKALESLLVERQIVEAAALDAIVDAYENKIGPRNGAAVVARAWVDPEYKARLFSDSTAAIAELGFSGVQGEDIAVVENTPAVHNMIVCTLCSCYPWPTLGLPPTWYKAAPYRSRAVIDPRGVLKELGLDVPADKEVRVWDSTAEVRYMVLPERPSGTDGWNEAQLMELITRDSMIGTGFPKSPSITR